MFVRAYLRASTDDQDATRAREALRTFAAEHGTRIAATYVENASGTLLDRRELLRLLADAEPGDVLLVEAVDRLSRLDRATWDQLRERIAQAGLQVVSLDLPLTHSLLRPAAAGGDSAQEWMTRAMSRCSWNSWRRSPGKTMRRAGPGRPRESARRKRRGSTRGGRGMRSCTHESANA